MMIFTFFKHKPLSCSMASIAVFIGAIPILFIHHIPKLDNILIVEIILLLFALFIKVNRHLKLLLLIIISFLWSCFHCNYLINNINILSKSSHDLEVTIVSVPSINNENEKIKVGINRINGEYTFPPLYAMWKIKHKSNFSLCAGQTWSLTGILKPIHASMNEGGYDQQRAHISQRIIGTFKNIPAKVINPECSSRQKIIDAYMDKLILLDHAGVMYALMFGERGMLPKETSQLLQTTGLSHLIAISGLHIGMSYLFGFWLARLCMYVFPINKINLKFPVLAGAICAFFYAWVSGFAIPATRALISLTLWIYIQQQSGRYFSWQWAIWSIGLIVAADPLAILSDSFWLSSFAVLSILYWFKLFPASLFARYPKFIANIMLLAHLQVGLLILLAPIQIILFQGINLMSFWANLWLVPLISWLVIPAILLLFFLPISFIQNIIFQLIDKIIFIGMKPLPYLSSYWTEIMIIPFWGLIFCWVIGIFIIFGWYKHYCGLLGCLIMLCIGVDDVDREHQNNDWSLTTLDVGHGLAVVIQQNNLALLYDTGNRWLNGSNAQRQIIPYLKYKHITPIGLILSHDHLDHTGGVPELIKQYPWLNIRSAIKKNRHIPCYKGQKWQWGKLNFEVLWPELLSKVSHNNDSCVILLTDGYYKILLTGDIEKEGEKAITALYKKKLDSDILFAPHHGSNTSSTSLFVRTVSPDVVIVSSARYSAWKIPSQKVYSRYKSNNIKWINTAETGQITIWFKKRNSELTRYRNEIKPRWYHLWFGDPAFPE
ncbi:DNA internalization-related competence protein ComEC/Rec2 [Providencia sneebia]|uniref:ComEC family competence protein n=1 Tax=Providencia sneebia DSM 19967 TaxID=1141660 RepID=K8WCU5_9GAMM|nr:DNA internalization-related competence protein ComEC/Rec2 [Providencia sneebia]EKT58428.1 ComEC family competence protein [Providencia sneebia DSM 19967]